MTGSDLLLPLRIPEIGPSLGKLVVGAPEGDAADVLSAARYQLVTRMIECAGEARRLAASGEREGALASLGRTAWLEAWEEAVGIVTRSLIERVNSEVAAQAHAVRMPKGLTNRWLFGEAEARELAAQLGSAGATLVPALDDLERDAAAALHASGLERDAIERWQASLLTAARRLEAAWLRLHEAVTSELARAEHVRLELSRWRPPTWPVVLVGVPAVILAVLLGLVLGGYLRPPAWLALLWSRLL